MKRLIFLILNVSILVSCSLSNRIVKVDNPNKGLKSFRLAQTPEAYSSVDNQTGQSKFKLISTYLFEERKEAHPQITINFTIVSPLKNRMTDTELFYNLDGETIKVASEDKMKQGLFAVPENLWVSIVHAQKIQCSLKSRNEKIEMELNSKEKNKLSEFFHRAIDQRDLQFPAIPEGKKKW